MQFFMELISLAQYFMELISLAQYFKKETGVKGHNNIDTCLTGFCVRLITNVSYYLVLLYYNILYYYY